MWVFSGVLDYPGDDTVMEQHGADALYSTVKRLMHGFRTGDEEAQQDSAHWLLQIAKPSTTGRWSES
jgi:hypothetical protein